MNLNLNKVENNLQQAYDLLINIVGESEHFEVEEAIGHLAEALARIQGDFGSFDLEEITQ